MTRLVRAAVLTNFLPVARELGLNAHDLLRQAGLNASLLNDSEHHIPVAAAVHLLELAAQTGHCQNFGLRMAEARQLSDLGITSLLISHQRTLRDALNTLVQYRHLLNDSLALQIESIGKTTLIREEIIDDQPSRQATELAVAVLFRMCSTLLGPNWQALSVNFTHQAGSDLKLHKRLFACRLEFNSDFNGFTCPTAVLDAANPQADMSMARYARRLVDSEPQQQQRSIAHDVRRAIYLMLPMGRASSDCVAQGLGLSVRTLQRQLGEAGLSFSDLLHEVRRELAKRYIASPRYSMGKISELLGYSTPSSFTRWFESQFGCSPMAWQQRQARATSSSTEWWS